MVFLVNASFSRGDVFLEGDIYKRFLVFRGVLITEDANKREGVDVVFLLKKV